MVEVVTLDSDEDNPPQPPATTQELYASLISSLRRIADNNVPKDQHDSLTRVLSTLHDIKNQCPNSYIESSSFREHVLECQRGLSPDNLLSKMKLFAIHMSTGRVVKTPSSSARNNRSEATASRTEKRQHIPAPAAASAISIIEPLSKRRRLSPPRHDQNPAPREKYSILQSKANITSIVNLAKKVKLASQVHLAAENIISKEKHWEQEILSHLDHIGNRFSSDGEVCEVIRVMRETAERDFTNSQGYWANPKIAACLKVFRKLEKSFALLHHIYEFLKLGYFRAHPPYIRPKDWFADESKVSRFTLCNYTMFLIFKRSCRKVIPWKHKSFVDAFSRKFKAALFTEKKKALTRIAEIELIDDESKLLQSRSYGATLLKCLNDCVEMFIHSSKLHVPQPALIELDDEESQPSTSSTKKDVETKCEEMTSSDVMISSGPVTSPISDVSDKPEPGSPVAKDEQQTEQEDEQQTEQEDEVKNDSSSPPSPVVAPNLPSESRDGEQNESSTKESEIANSDLSPGNSISTEVPSSTLGSDNKLISEEDILMTKNGTKASDEETLPTQISATVEDVILQDTPNPDQESAVICPDMETNQSDVISETVIAFPTKLSEIGNTAKTDSNDATPTLETEVEKPADISIVEISIVEILDVTPEPIVTPEPGVTPGSSQDTEATEEIDQSPDVPSVDNEVTLKSGENKMDMDVSDTTESLQSSPTETRETPKTSVETHKTSDEEIQITDERPGYDVETVEDMTPVVNEVTLRSGEHETNADVSDTNEATDGTAKTNDEISKTSDETSKTNDETPKTSEEHIDETPAIDKIPDGITPNEEAPAVEEPPSDVDIADNSSSDNNIFSQESVEITQVIDEKSNDCLITSVKESIVQYVEVDLKTSPNPQKIKEDTLKITSLANKIITNSLKQANSDSETQFTSGDAPKKRLSLASGDKTKKRLSLTSLRTKQGSKRLPLVSLSKNHEAKRLPLISVGSATKKSVTTQQETPLPDVPQDDALITKDDSLAAFAKALLDPPATKDDDEAGPSNAKEESESEEDPDLDETSAEYLKKVEEIGKLSKKLVKLARRIKAVKEADIGIDEMEKWGNLYCQEDKLKKRHRQTLRKLEEIQGQLNCKYNFNVKVSCGIPKIAQFIEDRINARQKFPDIEDVRRLLVRALKTNNMKMKETKIETLARQVFLDIGTQIQTHRKTELRLDGGFHLMDRVKLTDDPAKCDPELRKKLNRAKKEAKNKLDQIQTQFDVKQFKEELMEDDIVDDEMSEGEKEKLSKDKEEKSKDKEDKDGEDEDNTDDSEDSEKEEEEEEGGMPENDSDGDCRITN